MQWGTSFFFTKLELNNNNFESACYDVYILYKFIKCNCNVLNSFIEQLIKLFQLKYYNFSVCGHVIVLNYFADSLKNSSEFIAYRCHTLSDCEKKIVDNKEPTIYMNKDIPNSWVKSSKYIKLFYDE